MPKREGRCDNKDDLVGVTKALGSGMGSSLGVVINQYIHFCLSWYDPQRDMHTTFPRLNALSAMHASRSHYLRDCLIDDYPVCIAFASCFLRIIVRLLCYVRIRIQLREGKSRGKNLKASSK